MIDSIYYEGFYYLEIESIPEEKGQSIVCGVMVKPKTTLDKECDWGYLVYQDIPSERQRIIPLNIPPMLVSKENVECVSERGERFHFSYITYDIWESKVCRLVSISPEKKAQLSSTEDVQAFFLG